MHSSISSFNKNSSFSYRRIFIGSIIGLLLFEGLSHLAIWAYPVIPNNYATFLSANANNTETVVTLGNSHSRAIDFEALNVNGKHLWLGGVDLFELEKLTPRVVNAGPNIQTVLIPFEPYYLLQNNFVTRYMGDQSCHHLARTTVYHIEHNNHWELIDNDLYGWICSHIVLIHKYLKPGIVIKKLYCYFSKAEVECENQHSPFVLENKKEPLNETFAKWRIQKHVAVFQLTIGHTTKPIQKALSSLESLIEHAKLRNINVILYRSPLSAVYIEVLKKIANDKGIQLAEVKEAFMSWYKENYSTQSCVYFIENLWDPYTDGVQEEYFADPNHLNSTGAAIFSKRLSVQLEKLEKCT